MSIKCVPSALWICCVFVSCVADMHSRGGGSGDEREAPIEGVMLCDGAADCPADQSCEAWWCQQIQDDDPLHGSAWGTCRLAPVPDGEICAGGAGVCDNRACRIP